MNGSEQEGRQGGKTCPSRLRTNRLGGFASRSRLLVWEPGDANTVIGWLCPHLAKSNPHSLSQTDGGGKPLPRRYPQTDSIDEEDDDDNDDDRRESGSSNSDCIRSPRYLPGLFCFVGSDFKIEIAQLSINVLCSKAAPAEGRKSRTCRSEICMRPIRASQSKRLDRLVSDSVCPG